MPCLARFIALVALVLSVAACDSGESFNIGFYTGTYAGTRTVTDDGGAVDSETLTLTLSAQDDGAVTLTLFPQFGPPEVLQGRVRSNGFTLGVDQPTVEFSIDVDADGEATGNGSINLGGLTGDIDITGAFTGQTVSLTLVLTQNTGATTTTRINATRSSG